MDKTIDTHEPKRTFMGEDIRTILKQMDSILYIQRKIVELLTPERVVVDNRNLMSPDDFRCAIETIDDD